MNIICKMVFGSNLYGTDTAKSDTDYKGIYFPTIEELILQKTSKSINNITKKERNKKNTKDDIDCEIYSLHYFLQLAYKGETCALDMIHCPDDKLEVTSDIWQFIRKNRSKFYTKNLKAYLGYCRMQASKYGIKGSRLADAEKMINFLKEQDQTIKLKDIWDKLPQGENIKYIEIEECSQEDNRAVDICARKLMADTRIWYAIECIQKFYDSYGERAQRAKNNDGLDWKAISHAFRAGLQLMEIYETGDLKYPLKDADYIRKIKQGVFHYQNDKIGEHLEQLIDDIEILANKSDYPSKVNQKFWETWLVSLYAG